MRRSIASLAARLMAEDGITDYGTAKRKAARQMGAPDTEELPNNAEVECELRAYQAIYQADEQPARLDHLRRVALGAMRLLKEHSPYLVGHVLEGTAARYAPIELNLYTDAGKEVELMLLNKGLAYEHQSPRRRPGDEPQAQLEFDYEGETVIATIFGAERERLHKRSPHGGRTEERASLATLEAMMGGRS